MSKILIFDTEFTDNTGELLELSVFDYDGNEVFHSYFKPERAKKWMLYPHNITPEMVADKPRFADCVDQLQTLFDSATHLAGFEVESDIEHLHAQGIEGLFYKDVIELRELYWVVRGEADAFGLYNVPGLEKCATAMDIDYGEDGAHSATGDTRVTWRLLVELMRRVNDLCFGPDAPDRDPIEIAQAANERVTDERRRLAHGYVTLTSDGGYYRVTGAASAPDPAGKNYVAHIEVADWKRAVCELELMKYAYHNRGPREGLYRLSPKDIKQFSKYANVYDPARAEEYRKLYNGRRRKK